MRNIPNGGDQIRLTNRDFSLSQKDITPQGMTLRDYFAAHALTFAGARISEMIDSGRFKELSPKKFAQEIAETSWLIADAMIAERDK